MKDRYDAGYTKNWLEYEYITLGKSFVEIATNINVNPKTAWLWAKEYGIETRKRGANPSVWFKKGQQPRLGIKHTEATKKKISISSKGKKPYLKNGEHWLHHKGAVNPNWKGGITCERISFYSSPAWKKIIGMVWSKCEKTCQKCGMKYKKPMESFHIHHIVSFQNAEKRCDLDNLILLCVSCHRWVHSRGNKENNFIKSA